MILIGFSENTWHGQNTATFFMCIPISGVAYAVTIQHLYEAFKLLSRAG